MMKLSETFDAQETNDAKQGWCEKTITVNNGLFLAKNSLVTKFICLQEFFFYIMTGLICGLIFVIIILVLSF